MWNKTRKPQPPSPLKGERRANVCRDVLEELLHMPKHTSQNTLEQRSPFRGLGGFLIALLLLSILPSCKNDLAEIQRFVQEEETMVETIRDFQTLYSDSAVVRVKMQGPTMLRYVDKKTPKQEFIDGIKVEFFNANKQVTSRLTAKYAVRDEKENKIIVQDSVIWESVNKEILETSELIWDEKGERVYTNKFVTIRRPKEIIWGYGFESNQEFTRSKIRAIEGRLRADGLKKNLEN